MRKHRHKKHKSSHKRGGNFASTAGQGLSLKRGGGRKKKGGFLPMLTWLGSQVLNKFT